MKIRKAKNEDINQLANLFLNLNKLHSRLDKRYRIKPDEAFLKIIKRDLRIYINKPKKRMVLACEDNDKIVGFIDFGTERRDFNIPDIGLWIYGIYVDNNYRKKRVAVKLIKEVAKIAKKKKIKEIEFTYIPKNKESANFWKSLKVETLSVNAVINIKNIL